MAVAPVLKVRWQHGNSLHLPALTRQAPGVDFTGTTCRAVVRRGTLDGPVVADTALTVTPSVGSYQAGPFVFSDWASVPRAHGPVRLYIQFVATEPGGSVFQPALYVVTVYPSASA